jgi:hypothetical protein
MPEESSRKRGATSPLSSEFDKRLRLGLTDEELNDLNENLRHWIQPMKGHPDYAPTNPEDISMRVLAQTLPGMCWIHLLHQPLTSLGRKSTMGRDA